MYSLGDSAQSESSHGQKSYNCWSLYALSQHCCVPDPALCSCSDSVFILNLGYSHARLSGDCRDYICQAVSLSALGIEPATFGLVVRQQINVPFCSFLFLFVPFCSLLFLFVPFCSFFFLFVSFILLEEREFFLNPRIGIDFRIRLR